jgi:hypothetical protein
MHITQFKYLKISFQDNHGNCGGNRDSYTFTLGASDQLLLDASGQEVDRIEFTIVGNLELQGFFSAIATIKDMMPVIQKARDA